MNPQVANLAPPSQPPAHDTQANTNMQNHRLLPSTMQRTLWNFVKQKLPTQQTIAVSLPANPLTPHSLTNTQEQNFTPPHLLPSAKL